MSTLASHGIDVLLCSCAVSQSLPPDSVKRVIAFLADKSIPFHRVDDLCGLCSEWVSADSGSAIADDIRNALSQTSRVILLACEPRAVKWLLAWAGVNLPEDTPMINMRRTDATEQLSALMDTASLTCAPRCRQGDQLALPPAWIPWFPVIDRDACVNCRKCLDFCLFGVYAEENGDVVVRNPQKCKNNCPACARICPVNAVMFPKFGKAPINGGEVESTEPTMETNGADARMEARKSRRRKLFSEDFEADL